MDNFGALIKLDELVSSMKKKEQTNKTRDAVVMALAIIGIIAAVAGIAYAVYRLILKTTLMKISTTMISLCSMKTRMRHPRQRIRTERKFKETVLRRGRAGETRPLF